MTDAEWVEIKAIRDRDAARLREQLSSVPFYAKRAAERAEATGDEMGYWHELLGSQVNRFCRSLKEEM